jgi:putative transposase
MDEKVKFIAKLLEGEKMAQVCRELGVSRKTGYKIWDRYKDSGMEALQDRSRRPYRHANQLPFQIERAILNIKQEHPSWGAPKIREKLGRQYPLKHFPAISTIHAVLDRNGLVKRHKHRRYKPQGTELSDVKRPNQLWCSDYKGEFLLGNKRFVIL